MEICRAMKTLTTARFSTAIQLITWPCKRQGLYSIAGTIPGTCYDHDKRMSHAYATEVEAVAAILADPWIQENPNHTIQLNDCSKVVPPS